MTANETDRKPTAAELQEQVGYWAEELGLSAGELQRVEILDPAEDEETYSATAVDQAVDRLDQAMEQIHQLAERVRMWDDRRRTQREHATPSTGS